MDKEKIIEYIMTTPTNVNRTVLKGIVGEDLNENEFERLINYCKTTSWNTNRAMLESLLDSSEITTRPIVGEAIVGQTKL